MYTDIHSHNRTTYIRTCLPCHLTRSRHLRHLSLSAQSLTYFPVDLSIFHVVTEYPRCQILHELLDETSAASLSIAIGMRLYSDTLKYIITI